MGLVDKIWARFTYLSQQLKVQSAAPRVSSASAYPDLVYVFVEQAGRAVSPDEVFREGVLGRRCLHMHSSFNQFCGISRPAIESFVYTGAEMRKRSLILGLSHPHEFSCTSARGTRLEVAMEFLIEPLRVSLGTTT